MDWKEALVIAIVVILIVLFLLMGIMKDNKEVVRMLKIVILILFILLVIYCLYKIYEYYHQLHLDEPVLVDKPMKAMSRTGKHLGGDISSRVLASNIGVQYTYTVWMYIDNWDYRYANYKHVFSFGDDPSTSGGLFSPGVWLYPRDGGLVIRAGDKSKLSYKEYPIRSQNTHQKNGVTPFGMTTSSNCQDICSVTKNCKGFSLTPNGDSQDVGAPYDCNIHNSSPTKSTLSSSAGDVMYFEKTSGKDSSNNPNDTSTIDIDHNTPCDVMGVPLQRWFHIGVVLFNKTVDVYMNGKLARSCILENVPVIDYSNGNFHLLAKNPNQQDNQLGFDGEISQLRYFNRALNASEMYKIYSKGPNTYNMWNTFTSIFPKIKIQATYETQN